MAPKSAAKEKLIGDDQEVLQAVILADSFNKRFRPLTTRKPRCLLPVCNAPLLDWTFESLALAGVQEVFVICRSHADQVKAAIKDSKWSKSGSGMKIVPIMTAKETYSPGDAMRDIYTRGLVTSDFVLVMGDLVSNVRIDEVVKVHRERRKANPNAIMTMVVKEGGVAHRTRSRSERAVYVLDPDTSECLHYESILGYPRTDTVQIPRELLGDHPELEIRNDLIDCYIDVCSVEVPSLFQDNFDYLDIRRDFVHGVLTSDLLDKNIYCYVTKDGYAARVQDTKSYSAISKDILSRWTFPLVPDDNHPAGHEYEHLRGNKYIARDNTVVLSRTCTIGKNTLIGSSTQVFDNATVLSSVLGRRCIVGANVTITDSYIFDGTRIEAGCTIEKSIIGAGVLIKEGSVVSKGCLIGDGVVVGPQAKLEPFEKLSKKRGEADGGEVAPTPSKHEKEEPEDRDEDEDEAGDEEEPEPEDEDETMEEEEEIDSDIEEVEAMQDKLEANLGPESNALIWPKGPLEDDDEDEDGPENVRNQRFMRLGDDVEYESDQGSVSEASGDEEESSEEDDGIAGSLLLDAPQAKQEFRNEVRLSLERAFAEGHSVDNAAVELKTLRMASNVPLSSVREAVISAIVDRIPLVESNPAEQRKAIAQVVGRWGELINQIGGVDGVETVSLLQVHCASSERIVIFGQVLAMLYQADIVEEDDIRMWHRTPAARGQGVDDNVENLRRCWAIGGRMIEQFDQQSSEEESEEEEDDDD